MKRLLTLFLVLWCSTAWAAGPIDWSKPYARSNPYVLGAGGAAGAASNITADVWQTFEFGTNGDTLDTTNLAAQDNFTGSVWAVNGTPKVATAGEFATKSTVNASADTGTRGASFDCDLTQSLNTDLNNYATTQSIGFWFKTPTLSSDTYAVIYELGELTVANSIAVIKITNTSGTYTLTIEADSASSTITVASGTQYWITAQIVKNGTCSLSVFDSSGSQVGSAVTVAGRDKNPYYHIMGCIISTSAGMVYMDDFVVDLTDATYPLGP